MTDQTAETYRGYLNGPSSEELYEQLRVATQRIGRHQEHGALGGRTPRTIIVTALLAAHLATVRYQANGRPKQATGLVWDVKDNVVRVVSPDNRPGSVMHDIPVDSITSVEVFPDDAIARRPVTSPSTTQVEGTDRGKVRSHPGPGGRL